MRNLNALMKQAQAVQAQMAKIQEELANRRVEATSGGGMVTVVADGQQNIIEIKIDREIVNPDDVEMLEDLVLAAVNEAKKRSQEIMASEMSKVAGGLHLPGFGI